MDTNTKSDGFVRRKPDDCLAELCLDGYCTFHRMYNAWKFGKDAVTRSISDPASMLNYEVIHYLAISRKCSERAKLINAH